MINHRCAKKGVFYEWDKNKNKNKNKFISEQNEMRQQ